MRTELAKSLLIASALHLVGLGQPLLLEPDEGRYADVARELTHAKSWVVPLANGLPFLDKPPLVPWLGAASIEVFGANAFAVRLVAALAGILAAVVAAWLAAQVYGKRAAPWAALAYATSPLALGVGRTLVLDVPLAALMGLGLALVWRGAGLFRARPSHGVAALGGAAIGLATLVKGPVALGLTGLANALVLALELRDRSIRARLLSPLPWLVAVAVAAPWYALLARAEPEFFRVFFWEENLRRWGGQAVEHRHGWFFLIGVVAWGLGPWLPAGLAAAGPLAPEDRVTRRGRSALVAYAALVVAFFSLSSTKVETYVLPAFPALAAVIGGEILGVLERGPREDGRVRLLGAVFGVVAAALALASLGGLAWALGVFSALAKQPVAQAAASGASPALALLPLPLVALAIRAARRGRALEGALRLGLAVVAALPLGLGAFTRASELRSAAPVGNAIVSRKAALKDAKVAVFQYYYRGLPFYVDEPVVLLGQKGELRDEAARSRPELYFPDGVFFDPPWADVPRWSDTPTVVFLASTRPLLVVVPKSNRRPERFRDACARAGVSPRLLGEFGDDLLYESGP
jgi:4-amino-4-deoxy-L-arabinose transferase-like glycosyltransferase